MSETLQNIATVATPHHHKDLKQWGIIFGNKSLVWYKQWIHQTLQNIATVATPPHHKDMKQWGRIFGRFLRNWEEARYIWLLAWFVGEEGGG